MNQQFTCPRCGSHCYGSSDNAFTPFADGTAHRTDEPEGRSYTRVCQISTRTGVGGCGFSWQSGDDAKVMRNVPFGEYATS